MIKSFIVPVIPVIGIRSTIKLVKKTNKNVIKYLLIRMFCQNKIKILLENLFNDVRRIVLRPSQERPKNILCCLS